MNVPETKTRPQEENQDPFVPGRFMLCLRNDDYPASLEVRKVYLSLPVTAEEEKRGLVRVIDESGEDYLFPADYFLALELPERAERMLSRTGS